MILPIQITFHYLKERVVYMKQIFRQIVYICTNSLIHTLEGDILLVINHKLNHLASLSFNRKNWEAIWRLPIDGLEQVSWTLKIPYETNLQCIDLTDVSLAFLHFMQVGFVVLQQAYFHLFSFPLEQASKGLLWDKVYNIWHRNV